MSERSPCGIHVTYRYPCPHCSRANAANEAALAGVQPRPASGRAADTRFTDEQVAAIQRDRAAGESVISLSERYGKRTTTMKSVINGTYITQAIARKRHGERALPVPGQSARSMATIPTQRART